MAGIDTYTKLILHGDRLNSTTAKTITCNGNAKISTSKSKFGSSSVSFDGTNSYLSIPDSTDWTFGLGDWTIDFWINFTSINVGGSQILGQFVDANNQWKLELGGDNNLYLFFRIGSTAIAYYTAAFTPVVGTWYHLAFVRSSTTAYIFINGVSQTLNVIAAFSTNNASDISANLTIGYHPLFSNEYINAYIDELRISKGIARWTGNFTPATAQYVSDTSTVLLIHAKNTNNSTAIADSAGGDESSTFVGNLNKVTTYNGNAQCSTTQSKFGGSSLSMDVTGDYLSYPNSSDFNFGAGDFTIDFWLRFNSLPSVGAGLVSNCADGDSTGFSTTWVPGVGLRFLFNANNAITDQPWSPSINTWYHVAYVKFANQYTVYVDGNALGSSTNATAIVDSSQILRVGGGSTFSAGHWVSSSSFNLGGFLEEVRVSKGIARWTSNFSPPTSAYDSNDFIVSVNKQTLTSSLRNASILLNVIVSVARLSLTLATLIPSVSAIMSNLLRINSVRVQPYTDVKIRVQ